MVPEQEILDLQDALVLECGTEAISVEILSPLTQMVCERSTGSYWERKHENFMNYTLTFQGVSASDFKRPFANTVAGHFSYPQKFVHYSTKTREQEAAGQRRKGIAEVLGMVGSTDLG